MGTTYYSFGRKFHQETTSTAKIVISAWSKTLLEMVTPIQAHVHIPEKPGNEASLLLKV